MSHWFYKGIKFEDTPEEYIGFVYLITFKKTGQKYIGRKLFWSNRTLPPLKGKKRKRRVKKESDWKTYASSSKYVKELIDIHGLDYFDFEILTLHENKSELNYHETKAQFLNDVLESKLPSGEWEFLNENIEQRYYKSEKFQEKRLEIKESIILQ